MFAVIETGGKQYRVAQNDVIKVEKLEGEEGSVIILNKVLAVGSEGTSQLGAPYLANMTVAAEIVSQEKDDKVLIFKKKRRHNYRRKKGHRQQVTILRVQGWGENLQAKPAVQKAENVDNKAVSAKPGMNQPAQTSVAENAVKKPVAKPAEKKAPAKAEAAKAEKPASEKPAAKKPAAKKTTKSE